MDEDNDGVPDFNDNRYFMGQVAHVSVFNFALSQSQVAFLRSLYDQTSIDVYRAGGDHAADACRLGGSGGDGGSGWLYALGLLLGGGFLFASRLERVKQWHARWRGSARERQARRALPGVVVLAAFILGVVIGNGSGGSSFAWGLLTAPPLVGVLFTATRLYQARAAGKPLDGALRNALAEASAAVSTGRSTARLTLMASTDQTIASPTFTPLQPPTVLMPDTNNDVDLRATVDLSPSTTVTVGASGSGATDTRDMD